MRGFLAGFVALLFGACASTPDYVYRYQRGKTATLENGFAVAPPGAPTQVYAAIAAGNAIVGSPYQRGGGHGVKDDVAFDCSGAVSYVLREAGLMAGSMPSTGFRNFGDSGPGKWFTVYARSGHVFLVVAGLRFDTGWTGEPEGPRWTTKKRPAGKYVMRHPRAW